MPWLPHQSLFQLGLQCQSFILTWPPLQSLLISWVPFQCPDMITNIAFYPHACNARVLSFSFRVWSYHHYFAHPYASLQPMCNSEAFYSPSHSHCVCPGMQGHDHQDHPCFCTAMGFLISSCICSVRAVLMVHCSILMVFYSTLARHTLAFCCSSVPHS